MGFLWRCAEEINQPTKGVQWMVAVVELLGSCGQKIIANFLSEQVQISCFSKHSGIRILRATGKWNRSQIIDLEMGLRNRDLEEHVRELGIDINRDE